MTHLTPQGTPLYAVFRNGGNTHLCYVVAWQPLGGCADPMGVVLDSTGWPADDSTAVPINSRGLTYHVDRDEAVAAYEATRLAAASKTPAALVTDEGATP